MQVVPVRRCIRHTQGLKRCTLHVWVNCVTNWRKEAGAGETQSKLPPGQYHAVLLKQQHRSRRCNLLRWGNMLIDDIKVTEHTQSSEPAAVQAAWWGSRCGLGAWLHNWELLNMASSSEVIMKLYFQS